MEFDDFEGIEQVTPSQDEVLAGLKGWFHEAMLEDDAVVKVVSTRLDKEMEAEKYLDGSIRLEPIYFVDDRGTENYGISLTRHIGNAKWVMAQPDPMIIGSLETTGSFTVTPEFTMLLEEAGCYNRQNIMNIVTKCQRATQIFYEVMPDTIAPDPTCYNTFRLKEENQNIVELLDQTSDDEY